MRSGRLGNAMSMFASLLGIAHGQGRALCLDRDDELMKHFELPGLVKTDEKMRFKWLGVNEKRWGAFDKKFLKVPPNDTVILGYMQSWKYFSRINMDLRKAFAFRPPIRKAASSLLHSLWDQQLLASESTVVIGVHVRRGDMATPAARKQGYTVAPKPYFTKAFARMRKELKGKTTLFTVVSDNLSWCKNHLTGSDVKIASSAAPAIHLALLASCDHVIMSTGTYGWWGAWLAGGKVVYYEGFPRPNSSLERGFQHSDYYPSDWVGMTV